jgi:hypothetical protein
MPIEPGTGRVTGAYPYVDDQKKLSESYEDNPNYIRADYLTEAWQRAWQPGADPGKELAAGIGTDIASIGAAIAGEQDYPKFTAKSGENYIKAALGDKEAAKESVEMSQSGEQKIEDSPHMDEVSEWANTLKETGKLVGLGALTEVWNKGAGFFSAPIANAETTINQALSANNARDI